MTLLIVAVVLAIVVAALAGVVRGWARGVDRLAQRIGDHPPDVEAIRARTQALADRARGPLERWGAWWQALGDRKL